MYRAFVATCLILLSSFAAYSQVDMGDGDKLVGPVRTIRTEILNVRLAANGTLVLEEKPNRVRTAAFNQQGKLLQKILYRANSSVEHRVDYSYDAEGRESGWKEYYGSDSSYPNGHTRHAVYKYDKRGNVFEILVYTEAVLTYRTTREYDEKGNKTQEIIYNADGSVNRKSLYSYDSQGKVAEEIFYSNGQFMGRTVRSYNELGQRVAETVYNEDGTVAYTATDRYDGRGNRTEGIVDGELLKTRVVMAYDDKGRVTQTNTFNFWKKPNVSISHSPVPGKLVFTYNDRGQILTQASYDEKGSLVKKYVYTYDREGRSVEVITYGHDGSVEQKLAHEYDGAGNRVKTYWSGISPNGRLEPYAIEQRIITYY